MTKGSDDAQIRPIGVDGHPVRLTASGHAPVDRVIPAEVPVSLTYNGLSHVVMMASPSDLRDFVIGFSLTEGILQSPSQLLDLHIEDTDKGILLNAQIPDEIYKDLMARRRNIVGQTGCGLCGLIELEQVVRPLPKIDLAPRLSRQAAQKAVEALSDWQPLNRDTGAAHAAAFSDASGTIRLAREDVGRHNALDKLIGALAEAGLDPATGFAVLSSRCSYELVQKAIAARIPALVTISAPTELAVDMAKEGALTLIALARTDSMLCFHDPFDVLA